MHPLESLQQGVSCRYRRRVDDQMLPAAEGSYKGVSVLTDDAVFIYYKLSTGDSTVPTYLLNDKYSSSFPNALPLSMRLCASSTPSLIEFALPAT